MAKKNAKIRFNKHLSTVNEYINLLQAANGARPEVVRLDPERYDYLKNHGATTLTLKGDDIFYRDVKLVRHAQQSDAR